MSKMRQFTTTERGLSPHLTIPPSHPFILPVTIVLTFALQKKVTDWPITQRQTNEAECEQNISRGTFQASTECFQNGTMTLPPGGEKDDRAGMFILERKEAIIFITRDFLFHSSVLAVEFILMTIPSTSKSTVKNDVLMYTVFLFNKTEKKGGKK